MPSICGYLAISAAVFCCAMAGSHIVGTGSCSNNLMPGYFANARCSTRGAVEKMRNLPFSIAWSTAASDHRHVLKANLHDRLALLPVEISVALCALIGIVL